MGKGVNIKQFKPQRDAAKSCYYCERPFGNTGMDCCGKKTIDHVIAIAKGGYNDETNIVISCDWCNNQKGDLSLVLFEAKMGTLTETDLMGIKADIVQFNVRHLIFLSKRKQGVYRNNHPVKRKIKKAICQSKKEPGYNILKAMDHKIKNFPPPSEKHLPPKTIQVYSGGTISYIPRLTHHEWVHQYNLEPHKNFHYED